MIIDQRVSWLVRTVGAVLVAGAVFFGVVMVSVYERMLGVCFGRDGVTLHGNSANSTGGNRDCGGALDLVTRLYLYGHWVLPNAISS